MQAPVTRYKDYFFCCLLLLCTPLQGQENIYQKYEIYRNPVRVIMNQFSITGTLGYGATFYAHELNDVYFFQNSQNQYLFNNSPENTGNPFTTYTDWLNAPQPGFQTTFTDLTANPPGGQPFLMNTDTADLGFEGTSHSVPINLMVHYEFRKFRVGLGVSYERQFMRPLKPTNFAEEIRPYEPNFKSTRHTRFYGMVGYKFYSWWWYDFVAELNIGRVGSGPQFDRGAFSRGMYTNFGISIENNWSEYFRIIVRPSIDFKAYTMDLPDGTSIRHRQPTFFIQFGVSLNIPDIRRSPMRADHTQPKHIYTHPVTGRKEEVRGQPITRRQNPKIGENHRRPNQHMPSRKNRVKSKKRN